MRVRKLMKTHLEEQDAEAKKIDAFDMCMEGRLNRVHAAEFLDISVETLDEFIKDGALPRIKIGRTIGVPKKALALFMAGRLQVRPDLVILDGGVDAKAQPRKQKALTN